MSDNIFRWKPKIRKKEILDSTSKVKGLRDYMLKKSINEFSFDFETNTLDVEGVNDDFIAVGMSISWGAYNNYYIPMYHMRAEDKDRNVPYLEIQNYLRDIFEREYITLVGQNIKYDIHCLYQLGVEVKTKELYCTQVMSWLCDENSPNGLKENSAKLLGANQTKFKDVLAGVPLEVRKEWGLKANSKVPFYLVTIDEGSPYALDDAFYTWELYKGFLLLMEEEGMTKIYENKYKPFISVLIAMERQGVDVDLEEMEVMRVAMDKDLEELEYALVELAGVPLNLNSGQQLYEVLFGWEKQDKENKKTGKVTKAKINWELIDNNFGFEPITFTAGGEPSTGGDTLFEIVKSFTPTNKREEEGIEFCKILMDYKKLTKLKTSFIDGLKEQLYKDGKAHPKLNLTGTDSGRLSCSKP